MQKKVTTFLTYDGQAEEAMNLYTSVIPNSRITSTRYYGEAGPGEAGSLMTGTFELDGQEFMALNGGSSFTFGPGFSLFVSCETQDEVDQLWGKLSEGGERGQCGWLKDRFGVSWQIVPRILNELMSDPDAARAGRTMEAMLKMKKLAIAALRRAHLGELRRSIVVRS